MLYMYSNSNSCVLLCNEYNERYCCYNTDAVGVTVTVGMGANRFFKLGGA